MFNKLDKKIKMLWRINYALWILLPVAIIFVIFVILDISGKRWALGVSIGFGVLLLVLAFIFLFLVPYLRYKRYNLHFERDYLDIKKGLVWHKTIRIPYMRVQNVYITQGPLLRKTKLCYLHICTASRIFLIPGVKLEFAQDYKKKMVREALKTNRDM